MGILPSLIIVWIVTIKPAIDDSGERIPPVKVIVVTLLSAVPVMVYTLSPAGLIAIPAGASPTVIGSRGMRVIPEVLEPPEDPEPPRLNL